MFLIEKKDSVRITLSIHDINPVRAQPNKTKKAKKKRFYGCSSSQTTVGPSTKGKNLHEGFLKYHGQSDLIY